MNIKYRNHKRLIFIFSIPCFLVMIFIIGLEVLGLNRYSVLECNQIDYLSEFWRKNQCPDSSKVSISVSLTTRENFVIFITTGMSLIIPYELKILKNILGIRSNKLYKLCIIEYFNGLSFLYFIFMSLILFSDYRVIFVFILLIFNFVIYIKYFTFFIEMNNIITKTKIVFSFIFTSIILILNYGLMFIFWNYALYFGTEKL